MHWLGDGLFGRLFSNVISFQARARFAHVNLIAQRSYTPCLADAIRCIEVWVADVDAALCLSGRFQQRSGSGADPQGTPSLQRAIRQQSEV